MRSMPRPKLLAKSRAPGDHRRRRGGAEPRPATSLRRCAEAIGAPVYTEVMPNTASFPSSHPLYRGSMTRSQQGVREVLATSTTCCSRSAATCSPCRCRPTIEPVPAGMPLVHLDTDPWQVGKSYPARSASSADPKATLPDITALCGRAWPRGARAQRPGAAQVRDRSHQGRARGVPGGPRPGFGRPARSSRPRAARSHRRHAAEATRWWSRRSLSAAARAR